MAITRLVGEVCLPPPGQLFDGSGIGTAVALLDAADEKAAGIIVMREAKTISKIGLPLGTVTTGATVDVRLETINTSGQPSGTLVAAGANASLVIAGTDSGLWKEVTLTTAYAAAAGEVIAIVVVNPTTGFGNFNVEFGPVGMHGGASYAGYPAGWHFTTVWARQTDTHAFYVEFSDASVLACSGFPSLSITDLSLNTGTNPDEIGNRFSFPVPVELCGGWIGNVEANGQTWDMVLYDSDGSTVLRSFSYTANLMENRANPDRCSYFHFNPITLQVNTVYRLVFKPTTVTSMEIGEFTVDAAKHMKAYPLGDAMYKTQRVDAGAWTDTTTKRVMIGLLLSGFDDGGAAPFKPLLSPQVAIA